MLILLAILLPPVAVFLSGKPVQGFVNILLTLCLWLPGVIHALMVVNAKKAETRHKELMEATRAGQRIV